MIRAKLRETGFRVLAGASKAVNLWLFDDFTERTLSARSYAESELSDGKWDRIRSRIDYVFALFGMPDHCAKAWSKEVNRALDALEKHHQISERK